jgi:hypothetical protein
LTYLVNQFNVSIFVLFYHYLSFLFFFSKGTAFLQSRLLMYTRAELSPEQNELCFGDLENSFDLA